MDSEREKELLAKYPAHIVLMVKAAQQALIEGRAQIKDGILVFCDPTPTCAPQEKPQETS